jgi:trans-AT polyketide synthase/acyltransferase/oxidoreductase domain-containing protein
MLDAACLPPSGAPAKGDPGRAAPSAIAFDMAGIMRKLRDIEKPCSVVRWQSRIGIANDPDLLHRHEGDFDLLSVIPRLGPGLLGAKSFLRDHGVRCAYMTGAMAKGIASEEMVIALGRCGYLASYGSGGLPLERVEQAILRIQAALPDGPYAFNLLHSPKKLKTEEARVDLYLKHGVRTLEVSSFMTLTPSIVRYRVAGLGQRADGGVVIGNRVIVKLSRVELAAQFMEPPPAALITPLLDRGLISPLQAEIAKRTPMADDISVEADSGGHTDNRPLVSLLPSMLRLRDEIQRQRNYPTSIRIGAAGGISTPQAILASFMMGADYIVTGSINQSCIEAGTSLPVKKLLARIGMTDVAMAPESDMFEQGFKVQVVKQGSLFPMRAQKLFDTYRKYDGLDAIPALEKQTLERQIFKDSLENIWRETEAFFAVHNPAEIARAENPKAKMALVFRWYLGQSSRWAAEGNLERQIDYQIWCGPAMGAFNDWAKGTYLESPENRRVADIARVLMSEAATLYRLQSFKTQGFLELVSAGPGVGRPA